MMRWLTKWWSVQAARINAMSLRERIFLFTALIAASLALADWLWLSPAQASYQKLAQQFDKQSLQLQRARADLNGVARPIETVQSLRAEIAAATSSLDAVNLAIKDLSPSALREPPLAQVLVHVLRRHEGLTLVHVLTLAPDTATKGLMPPAGFAAATPSAELPARQGVELTVSGSYAELTRYLEILEKVLPRMRWGTMTLKSEKLPPELTLQLFLVAAKV